MRTIYDLLTYIVSFHLKLIAVFNQKIKLGVEGRKQTFESLESGLSENDKVIWCHCASLGEYEQGLPVFEELKTEYPDHKIVLSFFSPSGYEIRKNSPVANLVVYLPLDTKKNARRFLDLVHPDLVIFVKYEIWPNYLFELNKRKIRAILISALFRPDQTFFKATGKWMLKGLKSFDHIFVQNNSSKELLISHGISQVTVSGDTRFDRVSKQLEQDNSFDFIDEFLNGELCVIGGSTWPEDHELFSNYINCSSQDVKFIIVPHNIKEHQIENLVKHLKKPSIRLSSLKSDSQNLSQVKVLIIDAIGFLSKLYSYADIAYVGGAMGTTGLHNTLEAAVFGIPVVIGPNYDKFPEAFAMIDRGGMQSIKNQEDFNLALNRLISDDDLRKKRGEKNATYIEENRGSVIQIMDYIRK